MPAVAWPLAASSEIGLPSDAVPAALADTCPSWFWVIDRRNGVRLSTFLPCFFFCLMSFWCRFMAIVQLGGCGTTRWPFSSAVARFVVGLNRSVARSVPVSWLALDGW